MGERDNGYASCDLRRGVRARGYSNAQSSYGRGRNDNGYDGARCGDDNNNGCGYSICGGSSRRNDNARISRYDNDNDCGICRLFGSRNDNRDGNCGNGNCGPSRYDGDTGCGCSRQRAGVNAREERSNNNRCGCGCGNGSDRTAEGMCARSECHKLMNRLQKLDFSIQETVLYLDAYPDCCEALAHYRQLVQERCAVAKEYEQSCGPLTSHGNGSASGWNWVDPAWPWHPEFPGNGKA